MLPRKEKVLSVCHNQFFSVQQRVTIERDDSVDLLGCISDDALCMVHKLLAYPDRSLRRSAAKFFVLALSHCVQTQRQRAVPLFELVQVNDVEFTLFLSL